MPRQQLGKARPRTIKEQISPQIAGDYRVGASSHSSVNIVLKMVLLLLSYSTLSLDACHDPIKG